MSLANFLFLGRLTYFLKPSWKNQRIQVAFQGQQTIKHLVESLGVPHPEVGAVRMNGQDDSLSTVTKDGDMIDIFPVEDGYIGEPHFLLDCHLGRLTAYLRMLGFDCIYQNDFSDPAMVEIIQQEERILLTRDRRLLMRKVIKSGYCLRSLHPPEQLMEIIARYGLVNRYQPFHRCLRCNQPLTPVKKEVILNSLEPLTNKYFNEFQICQNCRKIYWKGSHYSKMCDMIERINNSQGNEYQRP